MKKPHWRKSKQESYKARNPWVRFLSLARYRVSGRDPRYDAWEGLECSITAEDLRMMWERDRAAEMEKPSLDRKDARLGYTRDNCRFIEHDLNSRRAWDKTVEDVAELPVVSL